VDFSNRVPLDSRPAADESTKNPGQNLCEPRTLVVVSQARREEETAPIQTIEYTGPSMTNDAAQDAMQVLSGVLNSGILPALSFDKNVDMFYHAGHWSGSELTYLSSLAQRACISVAFKFFHGC